MLSLLSLPPPSLALPLSDVFVREEERGREGEKSTQPTSHSFPSVALRSEESSSSLFALQKIGFHLCSLLYPVINYCGRKSHRLGVLALPFFLSFRAQYICLRIIPPPFLPSFSNPFMHDVFYFLILPFLLCSFFSTCLPFLFSFPSYPTCAFNLTSSFSPHIPSLFLPLILHFRSSVSL